ncbi:MAG: hypothetical protein RIS36_270 [Pseudomonadota bacterium]|jgi:hypothetical protein
MQRLFVDLLKSQRIANPLILDVGIGLGAPTLIDLAGELHRAGFEAATVVGMDASANILTATNLILTRFRASGDIPNGIQIILEHGDISLPCESPFSLKSIVERLCGVGTLADLCLSSNLLRGLPDHVLKQAITSMRACVSEGSFIGLGAGNSEDLLTVDVFRATSEQVLASFNIHYGESVSEHQQRLTKLLAIA